MMDTGPAFERIIPTVRTSPGGTTAQMADWLGTAVVALVTASLLLAGCTPRDDALPCILPRDGISSNARISTRLGWSCVMPCK